MTPEVSRVAVVGAGDMGHGIAELFAMNGYDVTLMDKFPEALEKAKTRIAESLGKLAERGRLTKAQADEAYSRIAFTGDMAKAASGADLVIEAVPEIPELKKSVLKDAAGVAPRETILASNTSNIRITELAEGVAFPDRVVGMHFFNPVPVMKLVEVIRGLATSQVTYDTVRDLAVKLEKTPVEVNDAPGFVSNRVLMPLLNEAMFAVMEGVATPQAVDEVFKLGMAHPMGPLTLADFIGLDVCLDIMRVMHDGLGDPKYRPCPLLVKMVDAGWLGQKSGRGFYTYS